PDSQPTSPLPKQEELLPPSPLPAPPELPKDAPPAEAPAFGAPSIFLMGPVGHVPYRADYRITWFPDELVRGQGTNLGYVQQDLSVAFPIWQGCADEFSGSIHVRGELFHTDAILPDTGQPFPDSLWNIRFGTTYRHQFDNGWITGGTFSFGSA